MRVSIIDIGNSKGIRLPQAVLKQALLGDEIDLEVSDGKVILKRYVDPQAVPDFSGIAGLDDATIQRALRKISGTDLITALVGADEGIKQKIYNNLSERVGNYVEPTVARLEAGDARDLIIMQSRNRLSEALLEALSE
jgi:antitoxin component of MazEF toxin-antitoxin module